MTSREKVKNAVNHVEGKVPLDFGSTCVTGIHVSVIEQLRQYYGLEKKPPKVIEVIQMIGYIEDDLKDALGVDTVDFWAPFAAYGYTNENWKEWVTPWGQTVLVGEGFTVTEDENNIYIYACGDTNYPPAGVMPRGGFFFDHTTRQEEIDDDNMNFMDNTEEFGQVDDGLLDFFRKKAKELENSTRYVGGMIGGTPLGDAALVPGPMLRRPKGIRDLEEWYISMLTRPDYIHKVFEYQTNIAISNHEKIHEIIGDAFDMLFVCGADYGTQSSLLYSPQTYRDLYLPYHKKINDWIHKNTGWKTFKHCCGSIRPLLPMFIEAGFDIINPVQWSADNMDRKTLKEEFGKDLVFWGGGVNTQTTLPFKTPEDVRIEVLETCEIFSRGGGYVFNPIHNIVAKTPVGNVIAMINALHEFNGDKR